MQDLKGPITTNILQPIKYYRPDGIGEHDEPQFMMLKFQNAIILMHRKHEG